MASYNRVVIVGNLTRDVELRYTPSGTAVTDIALAVNDRIKKNDQWVDEVNFFDVTLWGRTAEVAGEYLSKGSSVLIEGKLKQDRWEQEGKTRSKVKIVGEKMQMLSSRNSGGSKFHRGDAPTCSEFTFPKCSAKRRSTILILKRQFNLKDQSLGLCKRI